MNKKEALSIITNSAKIYHENLENKKIMIVFLSKQRKIEYIEAIFLPCHFLHLTGIKITNDNIKSSTEFYYLCLKNQLKISNFEFNSNETTPLKLKILPQILKIHKSTKMIGDYNNIKPYLSTQKIAGGIHACLGFKQEGNYYMPNTALYEDIRKTNIQARVISILIRKIRELKYKKIIYISKDYSLEKILKNKEIKEKININ